MKFCLILLVAALTAHAVLALPAGIPSDDAEVINVPRRPLQQQPAGFDSDEELDFHNFHGTIDTGAGYPFLQPSPQGFPFNLGFFDSFQDLFRRLRTRFWPLELAGGGAIGGNGADSGEAGPFNFNFDPKNGNTTSTVKVVNGHKIEVNETVYGDQNNTYKVRVVNIRPVDSDEDVAAEGDYPKTGTSAPRAGADGGAAAAADVDDDSNERREPLERKDNDNEIVNIDDPEVKI